MTLWRGLIALVGLIVAYIGWQEARLRLHCPEPVDLDASRLLTTPLNGPVWARMEANVPDVSPLLLTTDSGNSRGVWLPLSSPENPTQAVAYLRTGELEEANRIQASKGPVQLEGLLYAAPVEDSKKLHEYFGAAGISAAPGFLVLEEGRKPHGLVGSGFLLLLGAAGSFAALLGFGTKRRPHEPGLEILLANECPAPLHTFPAYESLPLTEDVKVELHHMVSDVLDQSL